MRKVLFSLAMVCALGMVVLSAEAQTQSRSKRIKKLSVKEQLAQERIKSDSLATLVEEYRQRESDWQAAWHREMEARKAVKPVEQFKVDYTPAAADSLAEQLKLKQVNDAMQNFFDKYVCEPVTMDTDASLDSLYAARIKELLKAGLPVELRALAVVESALVATAVSRVGATGLWQFMPPTGKAYGLEINSMVDERYDPVKSTKAACKHLKYLYDLYNDWSLALAAYNCGQGNVNKALARAGGNPQSFWDVYWFLPSETRGYVPAFIAASYAYVYHQAHNITSAEPPLPIAVDTVHVSRLMHLGQVSSTIDVPNETLKMLNPQYKLDIIPATTKPYTLVLPANRLTEYVTNEATIFAKDSMYLKEYLNPETVQKKIAQASVTYHKVKSGETLGAIARKYRVTTTQLMRWNGIKNANKLSIGQRLRIEK